MRKVRKGDKASPKSRYDERLASNARAELIKWMGEHELNQTTAGAALDCVQSTVQRALNPPAQPSLRLLIALREKTGKPIDVLLGLQPPDTAKTSEVIAMSEEIAMMRRSLTVLGDLIRSHYRQQEIVEETIAGGSDSGVRKKT